MRDGFCGWYFKMQAGNNRTVALIPAIHTANGVRTASLQIISNEGCRCVPLPAERLELRWDRPYAAWGENALSGEGVRLKLHAAGLHAEGVLHFGPLNPLRYDIMGPFRYVPFLECRHRVYSMYHTVNGWLRLNGVNYRFRNGTGYIEGDRGRSFPSQYLWTQCSFPGGALMLSVAEIPLPCIRFTGIIGAVRLLDREYRIATYLGARAVRIGDGEVTVCQGGLTLTARLLERTAYPLRAPASGTMDRVIRENAACRACYLLRADGQTLLDLKAENAAFEFEYR